MIERGPVDAPLVSAELARQLGPVVHELRNPLSVVLNAVQTLSRLVPPDGPAARLALVASAEAHRLELILATLVEAAHPVVPQLHEVDTRAVAEQAVERAQRLWTDGTRRPPPLTLEILPGAGRMVTDAALLEHILLALLANALRAIRQQGSIRLEGVRTSSGCRWSVTNTGQWHDADGVIGAWGNAGSRDTGVTGLGLAWVRRVTETLGGRVGAESLPAGAGRLVWVELPAPATVVESEPPAP